VISGQDDLPDSRLYTFIDERRESALYFLEGQSLIRELALLHPIRGDGFAYFRDVVLCIQPMIALIKRGEQFGFYIDSEEPYFRLKIETNHQGDMRSALVPEDFREFPETMRGIVRLQKLFPNNQVPYQSVLKIEGLPLGAIVNRVLQDSYQVHCAVTVSERSDQSAMIHQLPPLAGKDTYEYSTHAVRRRQAEMAQGLDRIFEQALHEPGQIVSAFGEIGLRLLASRTVRFRCGCSRERLIRSLHLLSKGESDQLFDPGQAFLDVACEYCKTLYRISRWDMTAGTEKLS
jgi:molecular chaperone Hsp33